MISRYVWEWEQERSYSLQESSNVMYEQAEFESHKSLILICIVYVDDIHSNTDHQGRINEIG
jgi:hypothetical protein